MLTPDAARSYLEQGLPYEKYVATGNPGQQDAWRSNEARLELTDAQRALIGGFSRKIYGLFLSGVWCGDCAQQLPICAHIERAAPDHVQIRYLDRDKAPDLADTLMLCGGNRVPVGLLLNEDYDVLAMVGDRTLSRYRAMAERQLGAACALPGAQVPDDEALATVQDWVDEFERAHLMARLSTKLRARYGD